MCHLVRNELDRLSSPGINGRVYAISGNAGVPVLWRPYHEMNGDWFWWGKSHCTPDEFRALWKFTVSYLRDTAAVHNFIYAFSPDNRFNSEAEFLERYPGDEWVDMVGMDNYGDFGRDGTVENLLSQSLRFGLKQFKAKKIIEKVAALSHEWPFYFKQQGVGEGDLERLKAVIPVIKLDYPQET